MHRYLTTFWTCRIVRIGFLSLALVTLAAGCGGGAKPRAVVKGKVTFGSGSVNKGQISFYSVSDPASVGTAEIVDGKYEVKDAPIGECKITVVSAATAIGANMPPVKRPKDVGGMPSDEAPEGGDKHPAGKGTFLPDKYKSFDSTDLTYTVEKGDHEHNIKLTP
jgi:hypothetical protein